MGPHVNIPELGNGQRSRIAYVKHFAHAILYRVPTEPGKPGKRPLF